MHRCPLKQDGEAEPTAEVMVVITIMPVGVMDGEDLVGDMDIAGTVRGGLMCGAVRDGVTGMDGGNLKGERLRLDRALRPVNSPSGLRLVQGQAEGTWKPQTSANVNTCLAVRDVQAVILIFKASESLTLPVVYKPLSWSFYVFCFINNGLCPAKPLSVVFRVSVLTEFLVGLFKYSCCIQPLQETFSGSAVGLNQGPGIL